MKDFADRMKEITTSLGSSSDAEAEGATATSLADKEALCDELMEIVENVDYARGRVHCVLLSTPPSISIGVLRRWPRQN